MNTEKIAELIDTIKSSITTIEAELSKADETAPAPAECAPTITYDGKYVFDVAGRELKLTRDDASAYLKTLGVQNARRLLTAAKVKFQLEPKPEQPAPATDRLDAFLKEQAYFVPGEKVPFGEFYERFQMYLPDDERYLWTKHKVSRSLPINHPSGAGTANKKFVANLSWEPKEPEADGKMLIVKDGKLVAA